jgi:hypothetical protein
MLMPALLPDAPPRNRIFETRVIVRAKPGKIPPVDRRACRACYYRFAAAALGHDFPY